jgi:hypothetical protein
MRGPHLGGASPSFSGARFPTLPVCTGAPSRFDTCVTSGEQPMTLLAARSRKRLDTPKGAKPAPRGSARHGCRGATVSVTAALRSQLTQGNSTTCEFSASMMDTTPPPAFPRTAGFKKNQSGFHGVSPFDGSRKLRVSGRRSSILHREVANRAMFVRVTTCR